MRRALLFFNILFIGIFSLTSFYTTDQNQKVFFAPFKNNASGAYTLIHDDFGGTWANGIELYADTMAFKRGIPFSFAVITGECDSNDWNKANEMISHGHQIINHSMYHRCGQSVRMVQNKILD